MVSIRFCPSFHLIALDVIRQYPPEILKMKCQVMSSLKLVNVHFDPNHHKWLVMIAKNDKFCNYVGIQVKHKRRGN